MPSPQRSGSRRQPEKAEQAAIVQLLRTIGAQVYVLGTKRRRGDYQGTMQTSGIPDVFAFLPRPKHGGDYQLFGYLPMWIEVKTTTGRPSEAQSEFREYAERAGLRHFMGTADEFSALMKKLGFIL